MSVRKIETSRCRHSEETRGGRGASAETEAAHARVAKDVTKGVARDVGTLSTCAREHALRGSCTAHYWGNAARLRFCTLRGVFVRAMRFCSPKQEIPVCGSVILLNARTSNYTHGGVPQIPGAAEAAIPVHSARKAPGSRSGHQKLPLRKKGRSVPLDYASSSNGAEESRWQEEGDEEGNGD